MPEISQAWLALIGAILGGSGLKFIEHYLSQPKIKDDAAAAFRTELREEVRMLRDELRRAETDLDSWREKYYILMDEFQAAKIDRDMALNKIQGIADEAAKTHHGSTEKTKIEDARDVARKELGDN